MLGLFGLMGALLAGVVADLLFHADPETDGDQSDPTEPDMAEPTDDSPARSISSILLRNQPWARQARCRRQAVTAAR